MRPSIFYPIPSADDPIDSGRLSSFALFCLERSSGKSYGDKSVEYHLRQVVGVLRAAGALPDTEEAGWAHDIVEDGLATRDEVREKGGERVENQVWAVSGFGPNRPARLDCVRVKIPLVFGADLLKLADRYCNIVNCIEGERWSLLAVYVKEHDLLSPLFPDLDHPLRQAYEEAVEFGRQCLADIAKRARLKPH